MPPEDFLIAETDRGLSAEVFSFFGPEVSYQPEVPSSPTTVLRALLPG